MSTLTFKVFKGRTEIGEAGLDARTARRLRLFASQNSATLPEMIAKAVRFTVDDDAKVNLTLPPALDDASPYFKPDGQDEGDEHCEPLRLPTGLVAYARFYNLDPRELAQRTLDEMGRDFAELLVRGVDPHKDGGQRLGKTKGGCNS